MQSYLFMSLNSLTQRSLQDHTLVTVVAVQVEQETQTGGYQKHILLTAAKVAQRSVPTVIQGTQPVACSYTKCNTQLPRSLLQNQVIDSYTTAYSNLEVWQIWGRISLEQLVAENW